MGRYVGSVLFPPFQKFLDQFLTILSRTVADILRDIAGLHHQYEADPLIGSIFQIVLQKLRQVLQRKRHVRHLLVVHTRFLLC